MKIIILMFLTLFFSCNLMKKQSDIAVDLFYDYETTLKKQNIQIEALGGVWTQNINVIDLDLMAFLELDVCNARKIYINVMEHYIKEINKNKEIRPYLLNFPFTWKHLDVVLVLCDKLYRKAAYGKVSCVFMANDLIYYLTYNSMLKKDEILLIEKYDEALKTVKGY